ncbi:MAG TPA: hypothetical protein P5119_12980 [Candidatus Aminicenantes bacterium]|nr:hypothetical protein [Candidatus Aminicenantes bacterium]HRY66240.1 hypothetical protein [Candidatus Aminicenantes bacterium]HRZ73154.1 hypothetical protein [Candidatus Aminicenantes bacterium]
MRRKLGKAIEPSRPEPDLFWDIPISSSLQAAKAIKAALPINESDYLFISGYSFSDCRSFLLYGILDEVMKVAIYLLRLQEFMSGPDIPQEEDLVSRLVTTYAIEEQHARERRLLEVLVALALFKTTSDQQYFRHFLLLEKLDDELTANGDLQEFYGARSGNIDYSIGLLADQIRSIEKSINPAGLWYRHPTLKLPLPKTNQLRPGTILSSYRYRLKLALSSMSDNEKLLVGLSYAGYAQKSESMHFHSDPKNASFRVDTIRTGVSLLGLLNFAVILRCHGLSGGGEIPLVRRLSQAIEQADWQAPIRQMTKRNISVGDFVLAYGDLAEVLEVVESPYKYRSYRVRYLAEKPIQEIREDNFPAYFVQPFYTRAQFEARLQDMVREGKLPRGVTDNFSSLTEVQVQSIIRASLVDVWNLGLRDWIKKRRRDSK